MRRTASLLIVAAMALIGSAAPVAAQEFGPLVITPDEGAPGSLVAGFVDTGIVAEECITTFEGVNAQFYANTGASPDQAWNDPGPVYSAWLELGPLLGIEPPADGVWPGVELFPGFWIDGSGPPPPGVEPLNWAWRNFASANELTESYEQLAAMFLWFFMDVLGGQNAAGDIGVAEYLPATFVLTFADIATQEPVGDLSNFSAETGVGQVNVPEVTPGLWAVAATCVEPAVTEESFMAAVQVGAAFLEEEGVPIEESVPTSNIDLLTEVATLMMPELMVPQGGPWVELYCVWDDTGVCPQEEIIVDPPINGPIDEELPIDPIGTEPRFTG